eukprot:gene6022-6262_t
MKDHGWDVSDPECAAGQLGASSKTSNNGPLDHSVVWFDSYFPQLHILGAQMRVKHNVYINRLAPIEGFHIKPPVQADPAYWKLVAQVLVPKDPKNWGQASTHVLDEVLRAARASSAKAPIIRSAGQYGKTLVDRRNGEVLVQNHENAGCVNQSDINNDLCNTWVIGTASIAAVDDLIMGKHPGLREQLLRAFSFYTKHASANGPSSLPWCSFSEAADDGEGIAVNIVVWVEGVSPTKIPQPNFAGIDKSNWTEVRAALGEAYRQLFSPDVLSNCSFWDERGIGYVHGRYKQPDGPVAEWLTSTLQYWINVSVHETSSPDDTSDFRSGGMTFFPGTQSVFLRTELDHAIQKLVADATQMLHQQVNEELATTDMIKAVAGALMDITITIVGIVAMASGHSDMYSWIRSKVQWLSKHMSGWRPGHASSEASLTSGIGSSLSATVTGKLLTIVIVIMGLIVSPAFILAGDIRAERNNADGSSSQVGLLSAALKNVENNSEPPPILIGAVTVRIKAEPSGAARGLLVFNLALASVAALLICVAVVSQPLPLPLPEGTNRRRLQRQLAKRRWTYFQNDSSLPHTN